MRAILRRKKRKCESQPRFGKKEKLQPRKFWRAAISSRYEQDHQNHCQPRVGHITRGVQQQLLAADDFSEWVQRDDARGAEVGDEKRLGLCAAAVGSPPGWIRRPAEPISTVQPIRF
jgi:hypothetical protein